MIANSYIPFIQKHNSYLTDIAKVGLKLTLFLIGCGLNNKLIKSVGFRPLIQGVTLWILVAVSTLWAVLFYNR
jgi:Kef-type K+ transport system membrane component KefB